jgi:hypothetical protein
VNHIIRLKRDIAEDVNVSLSLTRNFVNPVELRLTPSEGEYKEEIGGRYDYHKYEESRRKKQLTW